VPGSARLDEAENIVLAGHRDTFFRPLEDIRAGDVILLQSDAGRHAYRVEWTSVVEPEEVSVAAASGYPALTLVTCYPFRYVGQAPQRFVVRARRLSGQPELAREPPARAPGRSGAPRAAAAVSSPPRVAGSPSAGGSTAHLHARPLPRPEVSARAPLAEPRPRGGFLLRFRGDRPAARASAADSRPRRGLFSRLRRGFLSGRRPSEAADPASAADSRAARRGPARPAGRDEP
jgi:LPXTG-site transpeptidase (sortase) family protein